MAICSILLGFQTTPEGVFLVRTLQGLVSGFYPASVTLIASETPQNHTGWAPVSYTHLDVYKRQI